MKALKNTLIVVFSVVVVFYILPVTLLQFPYFQQKIASAVTSYLEKKIGTDVNIRRIEFQPFNKLILKEVYMQDTFGDTLFSAKRVAAGFDFLPLFRQKFHFSSAQIYTFQFHLSKENDGAPLNIQYIIDAFQNKKDDTPTSIDVNIRNLNLSHGIFSYHVKDQEPMPNQLNPKDVYIQDITAKIRLREWTNTRLVADVKRFGFSEKSGLEVKQLAFDLKTDSTSAKINQLYLELPRSEIQLKNLSINQNKEITLQIEPSHVFLKDICAVVPVFCYFRDEIEIEGLAEGKLDDLNLTDFTVREANDLLVAMNVCVRNLNSSNPMDIHIDGHIQNSYITPQGIQRLADNFSPQPITLPEPIKRLGTVSMQGEAAGNLNNLTAFVNFKTARGNLRLDARFGKEKTYFLNGEITGTQIDVKEIMASEDFGLADFKINLDARAQDKKHFQGHINALVNTFEYKDYRYENAGMTGEFTENSFKGLLNAECPDGQIAANGSFLFKGKDSQFKFTAKTQNLHPDKLNWTKKYEDPDLSFTLNTDFKGDNIDNLEGDISFRDLSFATRKGVYKMKQLAVEAVKKEDKKCLTLRSDVLDGQLQGNYSIGSLMSDLKQSISVYLPSLIPANTKSLTKKENNFTFDFALHDTQTFSEILKLPFVFYNQSQISGAYNNAQNTISLHSYFPKLLLFGSTIEAGSINLCNENQELALSINGIRQQKKDTKLTIGANFKASDNAVRSTIEWADNRQQKYKGQLNFTTQLKNPEEKHGLGAFIQFQPSAMVFNDSLWTLSPAWIEYQKDKISIHALDLRHHNQEIKIDGDLSRNTDDELAVYLNEVNLSYIFNSLNIEALTFGGIASGFVRAKDLYHTRQLSTNLDISDFSFNNVVFGQLDLNGRWDDKQQGVEMKGYIYKDDTTKVNVDGFIYPAKEEISIYFDAQNAEAAFLRKYLNNVVQDLSGKLTGRLHLFGDLNDPTVEGDAWVKNGRFGIEFLNTYYTFTDWVQCKPDEISIKNVTFYDIQGNKALANAYVKHHLFDDFHFSANISYENFLIFNATAKTNPMFYGPVFGTGTAKLEGTENLVNIDVSLRNEEKTALTLNFMDAQEIVDYDFINFVNTKKDTISTQIMAEETPAKNTQTEIKLNLLINATNEATVEMIMDPVSGDKISGIGNGNLQVQYGTKSPFRVFGTYTIEKGKYNFSLQQLLFRTFNIEEGSSIAFHGDPYTADLNIKAAYTVSANLGDLDQTLLQFSPRSNVPVNCILLLSGALEQPKIQFDLGLPGSTSELQRQVKSYIRTDDMMNRQMVFLLGLGRFYPSLEYSQSNTSTTNNLSFLTSTLSARLTDMLGSLSDKFQIGTNFHQTYEGNETNTEVELMLSGNLLNNRLIINGNFGYIDNPYLKNGTNNSPLVGDFDIEYKLTKTGAIRLKGFNHYNYRNYYSITPEMTQGFGILFRKDFNNFRSIFRKKPLIYPLKTKNSQ
ncbi:DUF490 domain-containing protein [Bacteroidia bacterium]|nr:DUF490 domain-containing protein [Bacteroidia bacterium]